jgi:poly-gamma-glutamate synthesis protein (capsule biosynthesis protein)
VSAILDQLKCRAVTIANNHILDYGIQGLQDTISYCQDKGIRTVGASDIAEKVPQPLILECNGMKIGVLAFAEKEFNFIDKSGVGVNQLDPVSAFYQITKIKGSVDFIISIVHAGVEMYDLPTPQLMKLLRYLVDVGSDVVITHHSHCISGYEEYKTKLIFYGIGNLFFPYRGMLHSKQWNTGLLVTIIIDKPDTLSFELTPILQDYDRKQLRKLELTESSEFETNLRRINSIISSEDDLTISFRTMCSRKSLAYKSMLLGHTKLSRLVHKLMRIRLRKEHQARILNMLQNDTHLNIARQIMRSGLDNE